MHPQSQVSITSVDRVEAGASEHADDVLAVEEPLQIRLQYKQHEKWQDEPLSITMRTPGNDFELTAGFLFAEAVINGMDDIDRIRHCRKVEVEEQGNVVIARLAPDILFDINKLHRHFLSNSSCGVCGRSVIDAVRCRQDTLTLNASERITPGTILHMNEILEKHQTVFRHTGGLHASALFDFQGNLLLLREDIGRHNALDKVVGAALFSHRMPLENALVFFSGRVSYELVQKALQAKIPIIVAVGAPSSLAVKLADAGGITLIGFLRGNRFNIYTHPERVFKQ
jgi:FdhD protein